MSKRLTAILTLLALGFGSAPVQAIRCVDPTFLDLLADRIEALNRQTPDALDELLSELADRRFDVWCGQPEASGGFWLAEGDYWVWRNNFADLWFPVVPDSEKSVPEEAGPVESDTEPKPVEVRARSEKLGRHLAGLADLLRRTYPDGDYSDVTFYPFRAAGRTLVPLGFQDGTGGLDEVEALQRDLQELRESIDSESPVPTTEAERRFLLSQLETEIRELQEGLTRRRGAPNPDDARSAQPDSLAPNSATNDVKDEGNSKRKGGGGILPSGAPPWLTDIFQMMLTYFGVKDIVQAIAMAIYLLEPELLEQLADLTGALTDGLQSDKLDQLLEVVQEIYALYNSVTSPGDRKL